MSFVANKMTEEEYKYLDLEKHEKNLINIGKIKGKSELFLENRKLLENKLNDKLDNKNDEFFENILKNTKFDDSNFYYDDFINFSKNNENIKEESDNDLLVFPIAKKISKKEFELIFLINILKFNLKNKDKEIIKLNDDLEYLEEQEGLYIDRLEISEKRIKELQKPDPKLVKKINKFNKRINFYNLMIILLIYIIYFTPQVFIEQMTFISLFILRELVIFLDFTLNLSCDTCLLLYDLVNKYPFESSLLVILLSVIYITIKYLISNQMKRKVKSKDKKVKKKKE